MFAKHKHIFMKLIRVHNEKLETFSTGQRIKRTKLLSRKYNGNA